MADSSKNEKVEKAEKIEKKEKTKTPRKNKERQPAPIIVESYFESEEGTGGWDAVSDQPEHASTADAMRWAEENLDSGGSISERFRVIQVKRVFEIECVTTVKAKII